jgi:branched-chain amino acid transport system substrate-binding protein
MVLAASRGGRNRYETISGVAPIDGERTLESNMGEAMSETLVGVLIDVKVIFSSFSTENVQLFLDSYQMAFDEAYEDGLLDRPVRLIVEEVEGLPVGSAHAVIQAWKRLAKQGVVAILGPLASENMPDVRDFVDRKGHIPTLSWAGTDSLYGEWVFGIGNGSLCDEPYLIANYLAHQNARKIAVVFEDSHIGNEYLGFFRDACRYEGLQITHQEPISQIQTDLSVAVEHLHKADPEAIVYLGLGLPSARMNGELEKLKWDPLRVMCSAFLAGPFTSFGMKALRGWVGVDQYDESNPIGQDVIDRFQQLHGYRPANFFSVLAYDFANVLAHAMSKAYPLSPSGVKRGLERVKMLPAATGGRGTFLSFAPHVRRAWLGADYLVLRKVTSDADVSILGDLGTELVHRITPRARSERLAKHSIP